MERFAVTRVAGGWTTGPTGGGGTCFLISWDRLEEILSSEQGIGKLRKDEVVERFEVGEDGVTVYVTKAE